MDLVELEHDKQIQHGQYLLLVGELIRHHYPQHEHEHDEHVDPECLRFKVFMDVDFPFLDEFAILDEGRVEEDDDVHPDDRQQQNREQCRVKEGVEELGLKGYGKEGDSEVNQDE